MEIFGEATAGKEKTGPDNRLAHLLKVISE